MSKLLVYGVQIGDRAANAPHVQQLLTEFGCNIQCRIGLHEVNSDHCSPTGVILLQMFGETAECEELKERLLALEGVNVQELAFELD
jgi:hypothetical protein